MCTLPSWSTFFSDDLVNHISIPLYIIQQQQSRLAVFFMFFFLKLLFDLLVSEVPNWPSFARERSSGVRGIRMDFFALTPSQPNLSKREIRFGIM